MKRISLVAALLGAVVLAFAGIAMAGSGPNYGASYLGGANGNGMQVSHYTADYTDGFFGAVHCVGIDQIKTGKATQDSFTCASTSGSPLANVVPGQALTLATIGGWQTDSGKSLPLASSFNATVSADGMSYTAVATY
jgi:hypothetical protein